MKTFAFRHVQTACFKHTDILRRIHLRNVKHLIRICIERIPIKIGVHISTWGKIHTDLSANQNLDKLQKIIGSLSTLQLLCLHTHE